MNALSPLPPLRVRLVAAAAAVTATWVLAAFIDLLAAGDTGQARVVAHPVEAAALLAARR
jgi:hypothetical protein